MIWLNGIIREAGGAIDAQDRGLLLGESVFETILLDRGRPQFWNAHIARLFAACDAFGFTRNYQDKALKTALTALQKHHALEDRQVLRISVTGGSGGRGLVPSTPCPSTWIMQISSAAPPPDYLRLINSDIIRLANQLTSGYKTGAYLDNIMARRQAVHAGADEAIMFNQYGRLACTPAGNLFVQKGRQLITPPVSEGALPGIARGILLQSSPLQGLQIVEGLVDRDTLVHADGLFVSNSVFGIIPAGYEAMASAAQKKQGHALNEALSALS